jgi:hypothetical protein
MSPSFEVGEVFVVVRVLILRNRVKNSKPNADSQWPALESK